MSFFQWWRFGPYNILAVERTLETCPLRHPCCPWQVSYNQIICTLLIVVLLTWLVNAADWKYVTYSPMAHTAALIALETPDFSKSSLEMDIYEAETFSPQTSIGSPEGSCCVNTSVHPAPSPVPAHPPSNPRCAAGATSARPDFCSSLRIYLHLVLTMIFAWPNFSQVFESSPRPICTFPSKIQF